MPILYDAHGNPINTTRLKEEIAVPTVTGVRQILSGHPAQNLRPQRLAMLLLAAEQGDATAYLELAEEMEEKDLHYRSVISTRKLQVSGLPIMVEAASDAAEDKKAADLVEEFIKSGVLQGALQDIMDAVGKGYSASEILWDTEGRYWYPREIAWRDPRWFEFDRTDGVTLCLKGETGLPEPLEPAKFIIHRHKSKSGLPIRGGLARPVTWTYLFKNFDIKAWVQFAQVFGFPLRLGRYGPGATEEEKQTLLRAVRNISQDAGAIIPEGMRIDFEATNATGNAALFENLANYFDRQISKLVLGQTGTTDVGQHVGTANAHEKVRQDIAQSDAAQLSATLTRDLVRPLVDLNLGPRKRYPTLRVVCEEPEDVTAWMDNLIKALDYDADGDFVEKSVVRDKLGVPAPAPKAKTLGKKVALPDADNATDPVPLRADKAAQSVALPPLADPISLAVDNELGDEPGSEAGGWVPLTAPIVSPIMALAEQCDSYDEFFARLPEALRGQDVDALARALSIAMYEQRVKASGNG